MPSVGREKRGREGEGGGSMSLPMSLSATLPNWPNGLSSVGPADLSRLCKLSQAQPCPGKPGRPGRPGPQAVQGEGSRAIHFGCTLYAVSLSRAISGVTYSTMLHVSFHSDPSHASRQASQQTGRPTTVLCLALRPHLPCPLQLPPCTVLSCLCGINRMRTYAQWVCRVHVHTLYTHSSIT